MEKEKANIRKKYFNINSTNVKLETKMGSRGKERMATEI